MFTDLEQGQRLESSIYIRNTLASRCIMLSFPNDHEAGGCTSRFRHVAVSFVGQCQSSVIATPSFRNDVLTFRLWFSSRSREQRYTPVQRKRACSTRRCSHDASGLMTMLSHAGQGCDQMSEHLVIKNTVELIGEGPKQLTIRKNMCAECLQCMTALPSVRIPQD